MKNLFQKFLIFSFIFISCGIQTFAIEEIQKGSVLSLDDCINIALHNSPELKKFKYNYDTARHNITIAKAAYFPKIGVGTGYNFTDTHASNTSGANNNYNAEANLSMMIFNFGKTSANINMKKFNLITALYDFKANVLTTTINVKKKYYGVIAARATVDINRANVEINKSNYLRTKAYFDEGIKSKIDLVNSEVNLSQAEISLIEAEKTYKQALVELNNSMFVAFAPEYEIEDVASFDTNRNYKVYLNEIDKKGDENFLPESVNDAKSIAEVETNEVLSKYKHEPFPYTFEESVALAYKNRSILKAYNATLDAMKENLKYVKREYYPELTASGGYGFKTLNSTNSFNVGVNLTSTVNILSKKHEIDNAKIQVELAENEIVLLKQTIYFQVQGAYVTMVELEKQIPLLEVKVRQTLENFELADGRYSVGLGDYIELQDAKLNYNNAQHLYVEAVYKYQVAKASLEEYTSMPQKVSINIEDIK